MPTFAHARRPSLRHRAAPPPRTSTSSALPPHAPTIPSLRARRRLPPRAARALLAPLSGARRRTPRQRRPSASPSSSPSALPSSTTLAFLRASASAAPAHPARRAGAHSHTSAVAFASPPGFLHRTSSCASAAGGAAAIAPAVPAARQRSGSPARDRSPRRTPHHALPNRAPVVPAALF